MQNANRDQCGADRRDRRHAGPKKNQSRAPQGTRTDPVKPEGRRSQARSRPSRQRLTGRSALTEPDDRAASSPRRHISSAKKSAAGVRPPPSLSTSQRRRRPIRRPRRPAPDAPANMRLARVRGARLANALTTTATALVPMSGRPYDMGRMTAMKSLAAARRSAKPTMPLQIAAAVWSSCRLCRSAPRGRRTTSQLLSLLLLIARSVATAPVKCCNGGNGPRNGNSRVGGLSTQ